MTRHNVIQRLARTQLCLIDIHESLRFAEYMLQRGRSESETADDETIRLAFETAMIVSYARPFSANHVAVQGGLPSLPNPEKAMASYSDEQAGLHKYVLELWNKGYAHSDGDIHGLEIELDKRSIGYYKNWVHSPLGLNRIELLRQMCLILLEYMELETRTLESILVTQDLSGGTTA